jgi:hypothetical protein
VRRGQRLFQRVLIRLHERRLLERVKQRVRLRNILSNIRLKGRGRFL